MRISQVEFRANPRRELLNVEISLGNVQKLSKKTVHAAFNLSYASFDFFDPASCKKR